MSKGVGRARHWTGDEQVEFVRRLLRRRESARSFPDFLIHLSSLTIETQL